jgi:hypothetical protein
MYKEYLDLKVHYAVLVSLYQRLRVGNNASSLELQALERALKEMEEKLKILEAQLQVRK